MNQHLQTLLDEFVTTAGDTVAFEDTTVRLLAFLEDQLFKLGIRRGVQTLRDDVPLVLRDVMLTDDEHCAVAMFLGEVAADLNAPAVSDVAVALLGAAHPFYAIQHAAQLLVESHRQLDDAAVHQLIAALGKILDGSEDEPQQSHTALVLALYDVDRALGEIVDERGDREPQESWMARDHIETRATDLADRVRAFRSSLRDTST